MAKRRAAEEEMKASSSTGKYEYDSDEDTEGGTWEHKKRASEMQATRGQQGFSQGLTYLNAKNKYLGKYKR